MQNIVTQEQRLVFNLDKLDKDPVNQVIGRQGDGFQKTIDVQLLVENQPYDLTKVSMIGFKAIKPDQTMMVDYDHAQVTDGKNGIFTYTFGSGCFAAVGDYQEAYFTVVGYDGTIDSTNLFRIKVIRNLVDQTIPSIDYVSPIKKIIDFGHLKIRTVLERLTTVEKATKQELASLVVQTKQKTNQLQSDLQNQVNKTLAAVNARTTTALTDLKANTIATVNKVNKTMTDTKTKSEALISQNEKTLAHAEQANADALASFNQQAQTTLATFDGNSKNLLAGLSLNNRNYWLNTYRPIVLKGNGQVNQTTGDTVLPVTVGSLKALGLSKNATLYITYDYMTSGAKPSGHISLGFNQAPGTKLTTNDLAIKPNGHVAVAIKVAAYPEILTSNITHGRIQLDNVPQDVQVTVSHPKLAMSNQDTGYSIAPEDLIDNMLQIEKVKEV
ncbi:BppU family phage baseplate upper protein [Lactiplantibacillus plantarum]|uniref:BppU family phage baseplate upper protein n=1 Tax=Lactiplantibacillus plantarum TaxID=1590 RepID=UPI00237A05A2|nr:BppU family phage baseplate upper protein [Lactiplantibacillus plantarum]WDQ19937.1 BppU family phage baseplate upper protein [Lactiplantibacillus plantarum]BEI53941.1 hypothetical protein AWA2045_20720 [Lactiplantibacillus plantarum]